jgi:hypothetical protein
MTDPLPSHEAQPLTVDSIVATAPAIPLHGPVAGELFYELEKQKLEIERLTLVNAGVRQDAAHRHNWGKNLFPVCAGWIVTVAAILVLEGFHVRGFHLDNSVLIAFIGTTTANVLGLGYIVVNYLFPKPQ